MVMEVRHRGEGCANELRRVRLEVAALAAYSVEELAAEGKVCYEIYYEVGLSVGEDASDAYSFLQDRAASHVNKGDEATHNCSSSQNSPRALRCCGDPWRLVSILQSHSVPNHVRATLVSPLSFFTVRSQLHTLGHPSRLHT